MNSDKKTIGLTINVGYLLSSIEFFFHESFEVPAWREHHHADILDSLRMIAGVAPKLGVEENDGAVAMGRVACLVEEEKGHRGLRARLGRGKRVDTFDAAVKELRRVIGRALLREGKDLVWWLDFGVAIFDVMVPTMRYHLKGESNPAAERLILAGAEDRLQMIREEILSNLPDLGGLRETFSELQELAMRGSIKDFLVVMLRLLLDFGIKVD